MTKYKTGDKFILEVTGVDNSGSRTLYEAKGLKGLCSENMLDNLEKIEIKTNADKIRAMSEEELAEGSDDYRELSDICKNQCCSDCEKVCGYRCGRCK